MTTDAQKAASKKYRESHREKVTEIFRAWEAANHEHRKAYKREWDKSEAAKAGDARSRQGRMAAINAIKEITPCADCGLTFPAVCMDFDHVRGDKVDNVSYLVSGHRRWEIIETEIAKCEIVCSNCHRVRTLNKKRGQ